MEFVSGDFTMDLRRLGILREVRDRGTIVSAATAVHLTPSAVSQQLAKLSREVGVPLLSRQGRRVRLTYQAHLLLEHAAAIGRQVEQARADLTALDGGQPGRVTVGVLASAIPALMVPTVAALRQANPNLRVDVREIRAPGCYALLDGGDVDIVITMDHPGSPPRTDDRYRHVEMLFDPFVAAVPETHALAERKAIELADLAGCPFVLGADLGPCADITRAACTMAGFVPEIRHRVDERNAALALVAAGAGVALLPRLCVGIPVPGVTCLPITRPAIGRMIHAVLRAAGQADPVYAIVTEAIREQCASWQARMRSASRGAGNSCP